MRPTSAHSGLRGPPLNLCDIIQRGYLSQVHLLVSLGANLEARDSSGRTPLMLTAYIQPEDWGVGIARLLIEQDVRMSHRDRHGMNALHHACIYERLPLARVLLNAPDFDMIQCDKYGNTALHYAAMSGNPELVRLLVSYHQRYRHPLTKVNHNGRTARDEAQHAGHHSCVNILYESVISASSCVPQPPSIMKDGGTSTKTLSECDSSVFFALDDKGSVAGPETVPGERASLRRARISDDASSTPKTGCGDGVKAVEGEGGKPPKLTLRRGDEEGGLFGYGGSRDTLAQSQGEGEEGDDLGASGRNMLSPFHTPPTSDRSTELKPPRAPNPSPRTRRSGVRRTHPAGSTSPAVGSTRRMSIGSSSSIRSGTSATKLSPVSEQGRNTCATNLASNDTTTITSNNNNDINNNNNGDSAVAENGTKEDTNSSSRENEISAAEPVSEVSALQRTKSPSVQSLRKNNILKENTAILNNMLRNNTTITSSSEALHKIPKAPRPPSAGSRASSSPGFRREPPATFLTRPTSSRAAIQMPYEKDPERVIHAASEHDFRNTREYVLKLTRMEFGPANYDTDNLPMLVQPSPSLLQLEDDAARKTASNKTGSWRNSIRFLYSHLELQCSPSWRDAAQVPAEPLTMVPSWGVTSPSVDEGEETKEKKVRRPSSSNKQGKQQQGDMNDISTSSNVKRKVSAIRQRKISAISPPTGLGDASSSDSMSTGSKKRAELSRP